MNNPFDITTYSLPDVPINDLGADTKMDNVPYLDIELPSTNVVPTVSSFQSTQSNSPKAEVNKDLNFLEGFSKLTPDNKIAYSYSADKDVRYKNLDYAPGVDMEKIYSDNQSNWDVFKKQTSNLWLNATNTFRDNYIGTGRTVYNLGTGQFGKDSFFNTPEGLASYLSTINQEFNNPIYGKEDAPWYSMKGWLGDTYSSAGFSLGSMATGITDAVVGKGLTALSETGIGTAAAALGIASLFNDNVRNYIGEENANYILGMAAGGILSNAISGGINKLTKVVSPKAIPVFRQAYTDFKASKDFAKTITDVANNTLSNLKGGTLFDATSTLAKEIKLANTVNKGLTMGLTGAKMYLSSGAESGMEAIQAQYDYIGEKLQKAKDNNQVIDDVEYRKIYNEGLAMSKDVFGLNRVLLGLTNYAEMGDIIKGTFARHSIKDLGVKLINEVDKQGIKQGVKAVETGSYLKSWLHNQVIDNLLEGFEEGSQYAISEGSKEYLRKQEEHKSNFDSYMYGLQQTLTTANGWGNIMSGIVSPIGMSTVSNTARGIASVNKGDNFAKGFTGYDSNRAKQVVNLLNNQIKANYDTTVNSDMFNSLLDLKDNKLKPQATKIMKQAIDDRLFNTALSSIENNMSDTIPIFIEDYYSKDGANFKKLVDIYGSEEAVTKAKDETLSKINKAKSTIESFKDYYTNPYTVSMIDNVISGVKDFTKGLSVVDKITSKLPGSKVKEDITKKQQKEVKTKTAQERIQETKIKASLYDSLVSGAARTMFIQGEKTQDLVENRENFKKFVDTITFDVDGSKFKLNDLIDLNPYFAGNQFTPEEAHQDLTNKIKEKTNILQLTKDGVGTVLGKNEQEKLDKEIKALEHLQQTLKDNESFEKEVDGKMQTVKVPNPLLHTLTEIWNQDQSPETKMNTLQFRNLVSNIQDLEMSIGFLSSDLKKFTSEDDQKAIVEYLYDIRKKLNNKSQERVKNRKEQVEDKLKEKEIPEQPIAEPEVTPVVDNQQPQTETPQENQVSEELSTKEEPIVEEVKPIKIEINDTVNKEITLENKLSNLESLLATGETKNIKWIIDINLEVGIEESEEGIISITKVDNEYKIEDLENSLYLPLTFDSLDKLREAFVTDFQIVDDNLHNLTKPEVEEFIEIETLGKELGVSDLVSIEC